MRGGRAARPRDASHPARHDVDPGIPQRLRGVRQRLPDTRRHRHRDYIHVADLAEAHVAALRRLQNGRPNGAYNLGTGRGYSVKEVLEAIAAETGETLRAPTGLRREGDPAELIADASLGRSELGWNPQLSDLQTIVRTAWTWHRRAHPKRNNPEASPAELSATSQSALILVP